MRQRVIFNGNISILIAITNNTSVISTVISTPFSVVVCQVCQVNHNLFSLRLMYFFNSNTLQWRHKDHDSVSNHQSLDCLLNCLFRQRSNKSSKLSVTGLGEGTGEFPPQRVSNAENVSILWRHHAKSWYFMYKDANTVIYRACWTHLNCW